MVWSAAHFQSRFQPTDLCECRKGNPTLQLGKVNDFCLNVKCLATISAILNDAVLGMGAGSLFSHYSSISMISGKKAKSKTFGFQALLNSICGLTGSNI